MYRTIFELDNEKFAFSYHIIVQALCFSALIKNLKCLIRATNKAKMNLLFNLI